MSETQESNAVLEKNVKAAKMWSSGGRAYDAVSQGVSEGIRHGVASLDVPGTACIQHIDCLITAADPLRF